MTIKQDGVEWEVWYADTLPPAGWKLSDTFNLMVAASAHAHGIMLDGHQVIVKRVERESVFMIAP